MNVIDGSYFAANNATNAKWFAYFFRANFDDDSTAYRETVMHLKQKILVSMLSVVLAGNAWAVEDALVKQADALLKSGNANEAYALLEPQQIERAGDPDFDYQLGLSALDSGHPSEAVFALERVLAMNPNHAQARAEIARAYLMLGETETSKEEFDAVKAMNPPPEVMATINKYLDNLEKMTRGQRTTISGFFEFSLGNDSNANSASSAGQIAIPAFGGLVFTRTGTSLDVDDTYGQIALGARVAHPLSPVATLFGGVNYTQRQHSSYDIFDNASMDGHAGLTLTRGNHVFSASLQAQSFSLDNARYRDVVGVLGQYQYLPAPNVQYSFYGQYSDITYPGLASRDGDRTILGVAHARLLDSKYSPIVFTGLYGGRETTGQANSWLGHDVLGLRLGGQLTLTGKVDMFGSASYENRQYNDQDPLFLQGREDDQLDLRAGLNYKFKDRWVIGPQVSYTENGSNISLYQYYRTQLSVSVRTEF